MRHLFVCLFLAALHFSAFSQCSADFTWTGGADTLTFTNLSGVQNAHYYWDFGDGETSYDQHPTHVFPGTGTYLVALFARDTLGSCHTVDDEWISVTRPSSDPCEPVLVDSLYYSNGNDHIYIDEASTGCQDYYVTIDAGPAQNWSPGNSVWLGGGWGSALWVNRLQYYAVDSIIGFRLKQEDYHTLPYGYINTLNYDTCSANFEHFTEYMPTHALVTVTAMSPVGTNMFSAIGQATPIIVSANSVTYQVPYYSSVPNSLKLIQLLNSYGNCSVLCTQTVLIQHPNYVEPPTCLIDPQPQDAMVYQNGMAQFTIGTEPGAYKQWQQNAGLGWQDLYDAGPYSGVHTDTLSIANCQSWWSNYQYRCMVTAPGSSCHNTSAVVILNVAVGIDELMTAGFRIHPNPATDRLNLTSDRSFERLVITITDALGSVVKVSQVNGASASLDIDELKPGLYVLTINSSDQRYKGRFVKQ